MLKEGGLGRKGGVTKVFSQMAVDFGFERRREGGGMR